MNITLMQPEQLYASNTDQVATDHSSIPCYTQRMLLTKGMQQLSMFWQDINEWLSLQAQRRLHRMLDSCRARAGNSGGVLAYLFKVSLGMLHVVELHMRCSPTHEQLHNAGLCCEG